MKAKQFVKAYDNYNIVKSKIYNYDGNFDFDFLFSSQEDQLILLKEYTQKRDMAIKLHYERNIYNTKILDNIESVLEKAEWKELSLFQSWFHQHTANFYSPNRKFISIDGFREAIYDNEGKLVTDERDIGTYNFFNPTDNRLEHKKYDVEPYFEWGNGINDKTSLIERLTGFDF